MFLLVPLLVVANGLTPYLELKTGFGWNMYANLRTADGETNHYLVPRTLPLTDEQDELVVILDSDDPAPATTATRTARSPRSSSAPTCPITPTRAITYERAARSWRSPRADDPELVEPVPRGRRSSSCSGRSTCSAGALRARVRTGGGRSPLTGPVRSRR